AVPVCRVGDVDCERRHWQPGGPCSEVSIQPAGHDDLHLLILIRELAVHGPGHLALVGVELAALELVVTGLPGDDRPHLLVELAGDHLAVRERAAVDLDPARGAHWTPQPLLADVHAVLAADRLAEHVAERP